MLLTFSPQCPWPSFLSCHPHHPHRSLSLSQPPVKIAPGPRGAPTCLSPGAPHTPSLSHIQGRGWTGTPGCSAVARAHWQVPPPRAWIPALGLFENPPPMFPSASSLELDLEISTNSLWSSLSPKMSPVSPPSPAPSDHNHWGRAEDRTQPRSHVFHQPGQAKTKWQMSGESPRSGEALRLHHDGHERVHVALIHSFSNPGHWVLRREYPNEGGRLSTKTTITGSPNWEKHRRSQEPRKATDPAYRVTEASQRELAAETQRVPAREGRTLGRECVPSRRPGKGQDSNMHERVNPFHKDLSARPRSRMTLQQCSVNSGTRSQSKS